MFETEIEGFTKNDFDTAGTRINDCRKSGLLPLDICAEDDARMFQNDERVNSLSPEDYVKAALSNFYEVGIETYSPISFWENQSYYVQMVVEKIDLVSLFQPVCEKYMVRIANARGWSDLHLRANLMREFAKWEDKGKTPVLLYCGDFDPDGMRISDTLKKNLQDLSGAVGWDPHNLIIDRFGLNKDFIDANRLSWSNNLISGSGRDLSESKEQYIVEWLRTIRKRKVEANALVVRSTEGRELCEQSILRYVDTNAASAWQHSVADSQDEARGVLAGMVPTVCQP